MRSLAQALQDHELIVLRVIGEWWEVDLTGQDKDGCIRQLTEILPKLNIPQELNYLPPDEAAAIRALADAGGRMPVASFRRQYGDVRDLGPAALEREEPWFDPQSSAEDLWYRGFIYRGFDQTDDGMAEFFFLPHELLAQFEPAEKPKEKKAPAKPKKAKKSTSATASKPKAATKAKAKPKKSTAPQKATPPPVPELEYEAIDETGEVEELEYAPIDEEYEVMGEEPVEEEEEKPLGQSAKPDLPDEEWADLSKPMPASKVVRPRHGGAENADRSQSRLNRSDIDSPAGASSPANGGRVVLPSLEPSIQASLLPADETACVDDLTTILTFSQSGRLIEGGLNTVIPYLRHQDEKWVEFLIYTALSMEIIRKVGERLRPTKAAVGWLQQPRETQMRMLAEGWVGSQWNELHHVPTLRCEGSGWANDPVLARNALLDVITLSDAWTSFEGLLNRIKKENPDFQRPNGNYETWYVRDLLTGHYLSGFESWESVEGRLLRFLIEVPFQWLGLSEVADDRFRLTPRAVMWLQEDGLPDREKPEPIMVEEDGLLRVPFSADRYKRFQVSRFAQMFPATGDQFFTYRITPSSLDRARNDGIDLNRVRQFLNSIHSGTLPAGLSRALERWSQNGPEGMVEAVVVLRVKDQSILTKLRQHPKTRPLLSESLGSHAAIVMADQWETLCSIAATMGLLLEPPTT